MNDMERAIKQAGWVIGKFGETEKWWNPTKDDGSRYVVNTRAARNICEDHGIKPFKITILWGETPEPGDKAKTYEFATEAELAAFKLGVEEMDGWQGWKESEEGYVVPAIADDEEEKTFLNKYRCDDCGVSWEDEWSCGCDDECPECGKYFTPYESEEI